MIKDPVSSVSIHKTDRLTYWVKSNLRPDCFSSKDWNANRDTLFWKVNHRARFGNIQFPGISLVVKAVTQDRLKMGVG